MVDYLLLSPDLTANVTAGDIFRKGVFSASHRCRCSNTVTTKIEQASDHAAIGAETNLA